MKLSMFETIIRAQVPAAKTNVVPATLLYQLINDGVEDVNEFSGVYVGEKFLDVVTSSGIYDLSALMTDFHAIGKSGLWWNNGTEWVQLDPKTRKELNDDYPGWRSAEAGDPMLYFLENSKLQIHPKAQTALAEGLRMDDYVKVPTPMTSGDHYPFTGSSTQELVNLKPLDNVIIAYVRWQLAPVLGKQSLGLITEAEYYRIRSEKVNALNIRHDIVHRRTYRMRVRSRRGR